MTTRPLPIVALVSMLATLAVGCASNSPVSTPEIPGPPPPYTADQIRDANPPDTCLEFLIEAVDRPAAVQRVCFVDGDTERSVIVSTMSGADGTLIGEPRRSESTWVELRGHAAFPPEDTTRAWVGVKIAAGAFNCWRYTVQGTTEDGQPKTTRYWFADSRPGPPILMVTEQDGDTVFRMELIADSRAAVSGS